MTIMSDKLKETLGIIESSDKELSTVPDTTEYVDEYGEVHQIQSQSTAVVPFEPKNVPTSVPVIDNTDIRDDYIKSRNITHTLIDMTGTALVGALDVATQSQHPKAFSVFNELASTMRLLSKDLLEMQEIYKNITKEKEAKAQIVHATQNNTIIQPAANASLADILKALDDNEQTSGIIDVTPTRK